MKKQRHIYFFLPNFSIGGAGNSIFNVCESIKNKDQKITVISIGKNHYKKNFKMIGVSVIEILSKKTIFGIIEIYRIIKNAVKKNKVIFVSNINYGNVLCSIFFRNIKEIKLVLIERTPLQELETYFTFYDFIKKRIIYLLAKLYYKNADYIISNSKSVSSYLELKLKIKVLTINPIIKIKKINKRQYNKNLNLTWIGRNSKEKNINDLLKSINLIKDNNFILNIVTNKLDKNKIKKKISSDYYKKIKFYNFSNKKKNLNKIYNRTDIYISTSIYEGFPNTVVEAITSECLIISSSSFGGLKDIIKNNKFGLLYKTFDYVELSNQINYAMKNFKYCKRKILKAKLLLLAKAKENNNKYKQFFNSI